MSQPKCRKSRISGVSLMLALGGLMFAADLSASEFVVVSLANGRVLTGEIDSRTDDNELWLHLTEPSIVVLSSTAWSDVTSARVQQRILNRDELRAAAVQLKRPIPGDTFRQSGRKTVASPAAVPLRVVTVEIVPTLASWDSDAEPDGIELRVSPLTSDRRVTAVDGLVTVRLVGRRLGLSERLESRSSLGFWRDRASIREYAPRRNDVRYQELGRWSERLRAAEATDLGYVVRLPFRTVHPEYDLDVALDAQIDAHLTVHGQGVYDATSPIQLRQYSPLREELQLYRGTRFFPGEFSSR